MIMTSKAIQSFDLDGVIIIDEDHIGVRPGPEDVIITGRSVEEAKATFQQLHAAGIYNQVFFNPKPFAMKSRTTSGEHKANTLQMLYKSGYYIDVHFEDDPIQADILERAYTDGRTTASVVRLVHNLTERENIWHSPK